MLFYFNNFKKILILQSGESTSAIRMLSLFQALVKVEIDRKKKNETHPQGQFKDICDIMEKITLQSVIFHRNSIFHSSTHHHGHLFQKNSTARTDDQESFLYSGQNLSELGGINKKFSLAEFVAPRETLLKSALHIYRNVKNCSHIQVNFSFER